MNRRRACFRHFLRVPVFLLCVLASLCAGGCKKQQIPARTEFVFGTICTINLFESGTDELYASLFARLRGIEARFSVNVPNSEISQINDAAGLYPVVVSKEFIAVLEKVCIYAEKTDGAFDPSAGPLVKLWNIGSGDEHVPSKEEIAAVLPLVDYRKICINREDSSVFLQQKGMKLDLGAAVKGYATDVLASMLVQRGVQRSILDLGGNVYVLGSKTPDSLWRVGIKNPYEPDGSPALYIEEANKSIVTSGVYERFFEYGGKKYHHIFDTKTGYPVENGLCSVTIIADSSFTADILSTAAFVLGREKGLLLIASEPDAEGICIDTRFGVYTTDGFQDKVHILIEQFKKQPE